MRSSSFSSDAYNKIGQQSCFSPQNENIWYTCKADKSNPTPFLGCCKSNPCSAAGCAAADLFPARLSDNPDKAAIFLSDSTDTPAADSGNSFPTGAIVGAALGGVAVISILVIAFIMWRRGFFGKKGKSEKEADESVNLYNPNLQSRAYHAIMLLFLSSRQMLTGAQSIHQVLSATTPAASRILRATIICRITRGIRTIYLRRRQIGMLTVGMFRSCLACRGTQWLQTIRENTIPSCRKDLQQWNLMGRRRHQHKHIKAPGVRIRVSSTGGPRSCPE